MRLLVYARLQWNSDQLNESYDLVSLHWCSVQLTRHAFKENILMLVLALMTKLYLPLLRGASGVSTVPLQGGRVTIPMVMLVLATS